MKKSLLLLAVVAASVTSSFAQAPAASPAAPAQPGAGQPQSPDQQADRRAQYLAKELSLSADQQAQLRPILLAQRQELQAFRGQLGGGGRRPGVGKELKATQAKYDAQIKAVLTPEQYAKFDQLKDDRRDNLREQRANGQRLKATE
ncbi:hypothetical protein [Hymenobacter sp.]|uniref:hypothetical protein n=1 Tax=Hymenobacter sp. TaxID=1898978 RepID=UPI00286D5182|nr:hypothetical protein [Hymenobacter sp.]